MPKWKVPTHPRTDDNDSIAEIKISEKDNTSQIFSGNKLYFYGDIDLDSNLSWNKQLDELSKVLLLNKIVYDQDCAPIIKIYIRSDGGDLYSSLSIMAKIEEIKKKGVEIYTIIDGMAASGATIISVSGTKRYIQKNACMMIHQLSSAFWGTYKDFQDEQKNLDLSMEQVRDVYLRYSKLDVNKLNEVLSNDLYFSATESLNFGLVDEII